MLITKPIELTQKEVSQDVQQAVKEYGMTVPEFLKAAENGNWEKSNYAVRELVGLIHTLPKDDPAFIENNSVQCPRLPKSGT